MTELLKFDKAEIPKKIRSFFASYYYPPIACLFVLLGYFTGLELIFGSLSLLLFCLSLWFCENIRHALVFGATFMYQISPGHAPTIPARSDYFFEGARPYIIAVLLVMLIASFTAYVLRTKAYRGFNFKECPLLFYMALLSLSFVLGGIFSETHTGKDILLGLAETLSFFFFFALFYFGFRGDALKDIEGYFCYSTLCISSVILIQMAELYLTEDVLRADGAINQSKIVLGWGVSTVIGGALVVLIPMLLYGAMRRRYPIPYFIAAVLVLIGCFLSTSRTALGVGALIFAVCMLIGCFFGERKSTFQLTSLILLLIFLLTMIGYYDEVRRLFAVYFEKGISGSGRFELWKKCVDAFFDHPLFGAGFFGLELGASVSHFAHNTILQMLGACGSFGIIAYLLYRIETVYLFAKKPSLFKTMLGMAALALIIASLLDIFIFAFFPMIYHSATLALACILSRPAEEK